MKHAAILTILLVATTGPALATDSLSLVACAPGYPGDTEQAQPTMDRLARVVEQSAGWSEGRLSVVYHASLDPGLTDLARDDAALAIVPLPFYLRFRDRFRLEPLLETEEISGPGQVWSLVAGKGRVEGPGSLEGWEIVGRPGYVPGFVRRIALGEWGVIAEQTEIRFSKRVLTELRRAAADERVAVLLDRAQADALGSLRFAEQLEVVTRSRALPAMLLCSVGSRISGPEKQRLAGNLLALDDSEAGKELLAELRLVRFVDLRTDLLAELERVPIEAVESPR